MNTCTPTVELPCAYKDTTWDGLTWEIQSTDSTEFASVLSSARFQLKDSSGVAALTLSSAVGGEITLNVTAASQWSITVEDRLMTLNAGVYSWNLETTDAAGKIKNRLIGNLLVKADPVL